MSDSLNCITPVDGSVYARRPLANGAEIEAALDRARAAQAAWRHVPIAERQALLTKAVDAFVARKAEIAEETATPIGTVKTRVRLAMRKLRDAMEQVRTHPAREAPGSRP